MDQTLTTFRELLCPSGDQTPGEVQQRASELFPERVAASRMHWWSPGDPIRQTGRRLLIGVAVWSGYDLRLLDCVETALSRPGFADLTVDVFGCDRVLSQEGFEAYVPGIGPVFGTPVVGLWVDGTLTDQGVGHHGRKIVADLFGFDLHELTTPSPLAFR